MNPSILKGLILRKVMEDETLRRVDSGNGGHWGRVLLVGERPLVQYVFEEEWILWTDRGLFFGGIGDLRRVGYSEILGYEIERTAFLSFLAGKKEACCLKLDLQGGQSVTMELRSRNAFGLLHSLLDFVVMKNGISGQEKQ